MLLKQTFADSGLSYIWFSFCACNLEGSYGTLIGSFIAMFLSDAPNIFLSGSVYYDVGILFNVFKDASRCYFFPHHTLCKFNILMPHYLKISEDP